MNFQVNRAFYKALLENSTEAGLVALGEQALTDSNEFVRVYEGDLKKSGRVERDGKDVMVTYNTPYAKRVYYTGRPSHAVNPNAVLQWIHHAQKVHGSDWLRIMTKSFSERMGK